MAFRMPISRIRDVTVTYVEVSRDLRYAKIHVSVMGDDTRQKLTLRGLQSAAGFLQAKIAERIEIRYTPKLTFLLDQGVKRSIAVAQILQQVLPKQSAPGEAEPSAAAGGKTWPPTCSKDASILPASPGSSC